MKPLFGPNPRFVIHTPLFAAAYVLSTALASDVTPAGYARPLVAAVAVGSLLAVACWGVVRNRWDGALLASAVVALLVSPASVARIGSIATSYFGAALGVVAIGVGLAAAIGFIATRIVRARRLGHPFPRPSPQAMNLFSIALLMAVVGSSYLGRLNLAVAVPPPPPAAWRPPVESRPDIVVVLLDGYPRSDVLLRRLGTDDSAFLGDLRERSFDVGIANHSNYTLTELTLPSMFQMRYLDDIPSVRPSMSSGSYEVKTLREAAEAGQAFSILRAAGYEVTFSASGWEHVTFRAVPDRLVDSGELTDLEESLIHRTSLVYLLDAVWPTIFTSSQRDRIVHSFETLDRFTTEASERPRFLFLHVPAPHLPPVLNADGSPTALSASRYEGLNRGDYGMSDAEYEAAWQAELVYVHERVLQGIDALLASQRGRDAVVVIMSDHGYNYETRSGDVQARLANLMAVRSPRSPIDAGAVTPINLLRLIFDRYLGTALGVLPDRYFIHGTRPLDLTEVEDPDSLTAP